MVDGAVAARAALAAAVVNAMYSDQQTMTHSGTVALATASYWIIERPRIRFYRRLDAANRSTPRQIAMAFDHGGEQ